MTTSTFYLSEAGFLCHWGGERVRQGTEWTCRCADHWGFLWCGQGCYLAEHLHQPDPEALTEWAPFRRGAI